MRTSLNNRLALRRLGTIPGSDVEYYTFNYHFRQYVPLGRWFTLSINADLGFGDSFGDTTSIAPFKQYFAGVVNPLKCLQATAVRISQQLGLLPGEPEYDALVLGHRIAVFHRGRGFLGAARVSGTKRRSAYRLQV